MRKYLNDLTVETGLIEQNEYNSSSKMSFNSTIIIMFMIAIFFLLSLVAMVAVQTQNILNGVTMAERYGKRTTPAAYIADNISSHRVNRN